MNKELEHSPEVRMEIAASRLAKLEERYAELQVFLRQGKFVRSHMEKLLSEVLNSAHGIVAIRKELPEEAINRLDQLESMLNAVEDYMNLTETDERFRQLELSKDGFAGLSDNFDEVIENMNIFKSMQATLIGWRKQPRHES